MSSWDKKEAKKLFQKLLSYNVLIEKPKIKGIKKHRLPFYDELNIYEMLEAIGWYAKSYKVEIRDS